MKLSKLSNQTNSQDPQAVNSRVFVGNLNTFQCSKTDVERMFQIYGRLAGISMHKGYAFVQFTNPFDARNACHGEDGRTVLSQTLDVNMVAEPKPHQVGRKRQNITKTGNDWDYYYDSYYSSTLFRAAGARPKKRKRLMAPQARMLTDSVNNGTLNAAAVVAAAAQQQQHQQQQQQHQQQQQQQQQQQHHQQHAAAAAAMAAMANLLPPQQQQLILHQQSLLSNGAAAAAAVAAAAANGMVNGVNGAGSGTTPHHSLNAFLQQQQQQHQQHQQQQHQFAGLHLKPNSPTFNVPTTAAAAAAAAIVGGGAGGGGVISTVAPPITSSGIVTNNNPMTTTATSMANCEQMSTLCVNSSSMMQQQQQQQLFQQQLLQVNAQQQQQQQQQQQTQWGPFKLYSNPDTLICGNCRECFSDLGELLDHKRTYCKLRFTCKCQDIALASKNPPAGTKLLCAVCKDAFTNPWDLMVHAQAAHMVNIYELGNEASVNANAANINNNNNISTNNNNNNNTNSINKNNKEINGISHMNGTSVTELDVCISTADIGTNSGASNGIGINSDGKATIDLVASKVNGTLNGINGGGVGDHVGAGSCNNSFSGDGNVSDGDACMEINGGMMCSPNGSIPKEEIQSDGGASLDGQMSISSPTHHSDDMMKLNGSVSSRGSSPALDDQPRACIVRTLSIEATSPPNATALGMMTTSLAISLTNGTATVSPTK